MEAGAIPDGGTKNLQILTRFRGGTADAAVSKAAAFGRGGATPPGTTIDPWRNQQTRSAQNRVVVGANPTGSTKLSRA